MDYPQRFVTLTQIGMAVCSHWQPVVKMWSSATGSASEKRITNIRIIKTPWVMSLNNVYAYFTRRVWKRISAVYIIADFTKILLNAISDFLMIYRRYRCYGQKIHQRIVWTVNVLIIKNRWQNQSLICVCFYSFLESCQKLKCRWLHTLYYIVWMSCGLNCCI